MVKLPACSHQHGLCRQTDAGVAWCQLIPGHPAALVVLASNTCVTDAILLSPPVQ